MNFLQATDGPIYSLSFSPDGAMLAAASRDGAVRLWDTIAGTMRTVFKSSDGSGFLRVVFLPNGLGLLGCAPGGVWHWDLANGIGQLEEIALDDTSDMALSADGQQVVLTHVGEPESIQCRPWGGDYVSWRRSYTELDPANLGHVERGIQRTAVSRNGRFAATAGYDGRAYVWNAETGGLVARSDPEPTPADAIAFAPDGRSLAVCDRSLFVWNFFQMTMQFRASVGPAYVTAVAFDPTGRVLAASCDDDTVRFWDTRHWQEMQTFTWDLGGINDLTFSLDGLRAACAGNSGRIVVWDVDL